jgi:uncharacterized membrane protein
MSDGRVVAANAASGAACLRPTTDAQAVSRAATSYWLALLPPCSACFEPKRALLVLRLRSIAALSSEHLLGMLVVWPVRFPAYPTGRGEVCRHRSPACGG